MKLKTTLLIVLGIALYACNNTEKPQEIVKDIETIVDENNHTQEEHDAIVLDNGKKWIVVPEMLAFIRNMEEGINNFSQEENFSFESYQELALLIDKNIRSLTENCTMEGQAHDELHKWLVPFIGLSEKFDVASDIQEQEEIYYEFKKAFVEFNTYFQ